MRRFHATLLPLLLSLALSPVALAQPDPASDEAGFVFALAQLYRFQGLYDEALDAFLEVVEMAPEDPYVHLEFGEFLFQMGRLDEAADHAELSRGRAPTSREALRLLGRIRLRQAEHTREALGQAEAVFEQLRAMDPLDAEVRVTLGRIYLNRGDHTSAAGALEEALDLRPGDRLVASLLVEAFERSGESEQSAVDKLTKMVAEDPEFLQARLALARALGGRGDHAGVVELLEATPEAMRGNLDYLRLLTLAYYRRGRFEESLGASERWLGRRPEDPVGRYLRSLTLSAVGREGEAEEILLGLLKEDPERQEWVLALAEVLEAQDREEEALALLRDLLRRLDERHRGDESSRVAAVLADRLARRGDWQAVLDLIAERTRAESGADGAFAVLRIEALQQSGRTDEALTALDDLVGGGEISVRVRGKRAEILYRAGEALEADEIIASLRRAGEVESTIAAVEALHAVDRYSQAVEVLGGAALAEPENEEVLFWLGASLERAGRIPEAEKAFRRLLELDGDFAPALNYLGYMWAERGENLEEAVVVLRRAVELEPGNGAYLDSLGWAYYQSGLYLEALDPLERAARLERYDAVVLEHLGDLYLQLGRRSEAARAYRRALDRESDNEAELRRKLEELLRQ